MVGAKAPARMPLASVSSHLGGARAFPGQVGVQETLARGQVLGWRFEVAPAVQRAAGHALEHHDVAGAAERQRGEHEVLADAGHQVEGHARIVWRGRQAVHIGQRQRALRLVELQARGVALEQLDHLALAGGQDDQVVALRQRFQLGHAHVLDQQIAAALAKRSSHTGIFRRWSTAWAGRSSGAAVDGLGAGLLGMRHGEADALDRRTGIAPFVDAQVALDPQRRVEDALAGHDLAGAHLVRLAVGGHGDVIAFVQQAQGQRHARLAAAHDCDSSHQVLLNGMSGLRRRMARALLGQARNGGLGLLGTHGRIAAVDRVVGAGDEGRVS